MVLYTIGIWCFKQLFIILSWVRPKMGLRVRGLKSQNITEYKNKTILIHCASAGEYEVIAYLSELIANQFPEYTIIYSFFSPSGVNWMKRKKISNDVYFLPFDLKKDMAKFIRAINPAFVLFSRKELWHNLLLCLQKKSVPHFLVSAIFQQNEFNLMNPITRKNITRINTIFSVDSDSQKALSNYNIDSVLSGDTRIDTIIRNTEHKGLTEILTKPSQKPIIIYGSVHRSDASVLKGIKEDKDFVHIIVPHETEKSEIEFFCNLVGRNVDVFSTMKTWTKDILIINKVGILAKLYQIADYTYIGGGFDKGIHNIIEPAIFGNTIFIGPKNQKFPEARFLLKKEGVIQIEKGDNIINCIKTLGKRNGALAEESASQRKKILREYINIHKNASVRVLEHIKKRIHELS